MKLQWYGTASLRVQSGETSLLIDPFVPLSGSPAPTTAQDYSGVSPILLTHAHPDHIGSLPTLCALEERQLYGTKASAQAVYRMKILGADVRQIAPGDVFSIGAIRVTVLQSRHAKFDGKLVCRTLLQPRFARHFGNAVQILRMLRQCQEQGETVGFLLEAEGKRVFVLGSLNLSPEVSYPKGVDLLVLPYQGTSDPLLSARKICYRLQPKRVFLDHFDDTFPPISDAIDVTPLQRALGRMLPICCPEYGKAYTV